MMGMVALKLLGLGKIELIRRETQKNRNGKTTATKKKPGIRWCVIVCDENRFEESNVCVRGCVERPAAFIRTFW